MTSYFILQAQERSVIEANAPSQTEILSAFGRTSLSGRGVPVIAQWVGAPRITRNAIPPNFVTNVAALVQVNGDGQAGLDQARATAANLKQQLDTIDTSVLSSSNWGDVSVTPYQAALNGPLAAWASGLMATTQTAANFPSAVATPENPIGPTTTATTPQGIVPNVGANLSDLKTIMLLAVVGIGIWYAGPLIGLWTSGVKQQRRERARFARQRERRLGY